MEGIIVVAIVFSVPIAAIVSWARIKMRRMELEAGAAGDPQIEARLTRLEREKAELQTRIETLESIVTMDEPAPPRTRVRVESEGRARVAEEDELGARGDDARRAGR